MRRSQPLLGDPKAAVLAKVGAEGGKVGPGFHSR